jgi:hypothetical protein
MKRFGIALALIALPAFGGVTYQFESTSTGLREAALVGAVSIEGSNVRMDMKSGDNLLFKDGSIVLSNDGGKTLSVYDPSAKTYYVVNLKDLLNAGGLMGAAGGMFKLTIENPKVNVKDLGDGGVISGYPTKHARVDAAFDIAVNAMGTAITTHMSMSTESWTTDRLGAEFTNFLQEKNVRTGMPEIDKLIQAQSAAIGGRFPLKQVTTMKVSQGAGNEMTSTTTSTVSNIEKKTLAPTTFTAPAGYTKVDDPVSRMMKGVVR